MKYKQIGKGGLISSNLTLGTRVFWGKSTRSTPKKDALEMIDHYLAAGGNHIDTSDVYAEGRSDQLSQIPVRYPYRMIDAYRQRKL